MKATRKLIFFLSILAVIAVLFPVFGALTSSVQVTVGHTNTSSSGLGTANDTLGYTINKTFSNGSGTTQVADLVYHASRSLTTAASETLDLYGGLTDAFGTTLNFARIKSITIENTSGSMTVTLGAADAPVALFDPATATVLIKPYGAVTLVAPLAGWTVTDSSADGIKILNSAGDTTTYKIHIVGSST